jgi:hypothetical protein
MSFFKATKPKAKVLTEPYAAAGKSWLENFIKSWSTEGVPDIPELQTAEMSPLEKANLGLIGNYAQNGTEGYNLAMGNVKNTLAQNDNPVTDPGYRAYLAEQERLRGGSTSRLLRSAKLGGTVDNSVAQGTLGDQNRAYDSMILDKLNNVRNDLLARKERAAGMAAGLGQEQVGNAVTAMSAADQERQIEQAKNTAKYTKMMTTVMFPYQQWAQIALNAANAGTYKYMQEGGPSGLTSIQGAVKGITGTIGDIGDFMGGL